MTGCQVWFEDPVKKLITHKLLTSLVLAPLIMLVNLVIRAMCLNDHEQVYAKFFSKKVESESMKIKTIQMLQQLKCEMLAKSSSKC